MLATTTHDTKRSEDVRARIDVLSEWPRPWRRALTRWNRMNRTRRRIVDDQPAPGPHAEYLLYQTLLGTWPTGAPGEAEFAAYRLRIEEYMIKAMREAKRRTSWLNVNEEYEDALRQFIRSVLERADGSAFTQELAALAQDVARVGLCNSIAMTLLKLTAPGVPDIYQGNELIDLSLVDPDNRRPVDYARRRELLAAQRRESPAGARLPPEKLAALLDDAEGAAKMFVTWKALDHRRRHARLFRDGAYVPLQTAGRAASHVCAFARVLGDDVAIAVAPRLTARLGRPPLGEAAWHDTRIALQGRVATQRAWRCALTGHETAASAEAPPASLQVARVLAHFPVALLVAEPRDAAGD
jgi:(1->4)-alpha-D-glucan 1-alpha-D-glucosylmutase